jgi:hypothetical protein
VSTRKESWIDPLVGAAFSRSLARRWDLEARGDVGGFGVGSKLTWSLEATIQWKLGRHLGLAGGYRVFDVDFDDQRTYTLPDGGQVTPPSTYTTRTHGPTIGLTFHW